MEGNIIKLEDDPDINKLAIIMNVFITFLVLLSVCSAIYFFILIEQSHTRMEESLDRCDQIIIEIKNRKGDNN